MPTNKQRNEILAIEGDLNALTSPAYLALRPSAGSTRVQNQILEEAQNRDFDIDAHRVLGKHAHEVIGQMGRTGASQFHQTIAHHAALLQESHGSSLLQLEQQFAAMNLQVTMQNILAISDGIGQNLRELSAQSIYQPQQTQKRRWGR